MTPDTEVNTEFSLPTVKAVEYVVISRCETGTEILRQRAIAVNAANIETWWTAEGKGWLEYVKHLKTCDTCKTFQIANQVHREDLPTLEEK